jgi:hypothetical protein
MKRSVVSLVLLFVSISATAADSDRKHVVLDPSRVADGSMATVATRREHNFVSEKTRTTMNPEFP